MLMTFWTSVALVFVMLTTSTAHAVADFVAAEETAARTDAIVHLVLMAIVASILFVGLPAVAPS